MKRIIIVALSIFLLFGLAGCKDSNKEPTIISDIAYDVNSKSDNIIYVNENGIYTPFIVLTDNYNGNTLLLREELLREPMQINDYYSYYEYSTIDNYLNNEYLDSLKESDDLILESNIEIASEESTISPVEETISITRKVFLLSCTELNYKKTTFCAEGKPLKYFENYENRIAYRNGERKSWWTRTAERGYKCCTIGIGPENSMGFGNSSSQNGIRPAFCVSPSTEIIKRNDIIQGKTVYCIK